MRAFLISTASLVLGVVACSGTDGVARSDVAPTSAPDGAGSQPGADGEPGGTPATGKEDGGSSGGSSSGEPEGPTDTRAGNVTVTSTAYAIGATQIEMGSATGSFYRVPPPVPGAPSTGGCQTTTTGACTVTTCTFSGSTGTSAVTYTDAGPIVISGVDVNDGDMTLTPGGAYGYQAVNGNVAFFRGGESIRFSAPGKAGGAPSYDVTLTAPSSPRITAPTFDTQGRVVMTPGQDLAIAWVSANTDVIAQITAGTGSKSVTARCVFPGSTKQGKVPAAVISSVKSAGAQASFLVTSESKKVETKGGWNTTFSLQSWGVRDGGLASGLVP
jgi:hypothetical protein